MSWLLFMALLVPFLLIRNAVIKQRRKFQDEQEKREKWNSEMHGFANAEELSRNRN